MRPTRLHLSALCLMLLATAPACVGTVGDDEAPPESSELLFDVHGPAGGDQRYAIDVSLWAGEITDAEMACWYAQGVRHVIVGTQNPRITRQQLDMAIAGGMTVDLYEYLQWDQSITEQVQGSLVIAADYPVGRLWLDAEEDPAGRSPAQLAALLDEGLDACGEFECGIYTGEWWWTPAMAASTAYTDAPLWYAHYDGDPSMATWSSQAFGGWVAPTGKQFNETYVCGVHCDVNTMVVHAEQPPAPEPALPPEGLPGAPSGLYPDDALQIRAEEVRMMCDTIPGVWRYAFEIEFAFNGAYRPYHVFEGAENARKFVPSVDNTIYRWRVRAQNGYGWGAWSGWASFEYGWATELPEDLTADDPPEEDPPADDPPTGDPPVDGAPTHVQPADGSVAPPPSITMSCDPVAGATAYRFEVEHHDGSSFLPYHAYEPSSASQTFWPVHDHRLFRFRVSAKTSGVWGTASAWHEVLFGPT